MLGMIITFYRKEEKDREYQDQSKINRAVASLSVSELEAAGIMLRELNSLEGLLVPVDWRTKSNRRAPLLSML